MVTLVSMTIDEDKPKSLICCQLISQTVQINQLKSDSLADLRLWQNS